MDLLSKEHFPLLLFDNDQAKTPLSNTGIASMDWYMSLSKKSQARVLDDHGFNQDKEVLDMHTLKEIYRRVHNLI
ncbi:MAG: hypothetical protein Crog4KO_19220 [Crocinitomicaceae bacterium]